MSVNGAPFQYIAFPMEAMNALTAGKIKPADAGVLLAILKFRKNGQATAWVKNETIVRLTGLCINTVQVSLHRLRKAGLIHRYSCERPDPMDPENTTGYRFAIGTAEGLPLVHVGPQNLGPQIVGPQILGTQNLGTNSNGSIQLDGKKKLDGRGGEAPPKSAPTSWDARQQEVIDLATVRWGASCGDSVVGDLLRTYSAEIVMAAIDSHWDRDGQRLKPAYLRAICQRLFNDAAAKPESNGKPHAGKPSAGKRALSKSYGVIPGP